jgi:hypothetical protein
LGLFVAVPLLGSLLVALLRPGPAREVSARIATAAFYVLLFAFFAERTRVALAEGSTAGLIAFGFLAAIFGIGLVLAVVKAIGALRGRTSSDAAATH